MAFITLVAESFILVNMFNYAAALWIREGAKHPSQSLRESAAESGPPKSKGHNLIFQ